MKSQAKNIKSLSDHFLIAMPQMKDPIFSGSVVYVCEHSDNGAMGVIINKPSPLRMGQFFAAVEKPTPKQYAEKWVLIGGPMQVDRGFLVHTPVGNWQSSLLVNDQIAITTSKDIINSLSEDEQQQFKTVATIGYSSWAGGQLESELNENSWLIVPADTKILFDLPYFKRYQAALNLLGIQIENLSAYTGHA